MMGLLSDKRILEEMERGRIVIEPFDERFLGTNSYDVCMGSYFYRENPYMNIVSLSDKETVQLLWDGPYWEEYRIPVRSHETILAHTIEVIGGRGGITTEMKSRSTIGRCHLSVCKCSGLGDVGYISRWTMEITNHGNTCIEIPFGFRVAQIKFYDVGPTNKEYHGKYGQETEWKPEDMLPKPYLDTY
jgi:dCTP deaminase